MLRTLTATTAIALLLGAGSALATPTVSGTLSVYVGNNTNGSSTTPLSSYGTADSAHTSWEGKFTGTAPAYLAGERAVYADLNALTAGTNPATATLSLGKNTPFTPITMVMDYTSGSATLSVVPRRATLESARLSAAKRMCAPSVSGLARSVSSTT